MKKSQSIRKTEYVTRVGILTAIATVMYFFLPEIPLAFANLKFDVSDIPAMIAALTTGPAAGMTVIILKNILHAIKSSSFGIGELINIVIGASMIFPLLGFYGLFKKLRKKSDVNDHPSYLFASVITVVITVAVGIVLNMLLTPVYLNMLGMEFTWPIVLERVAASIPLNILKGAANTVLVYPIYLSVQKLNLPVYGEKIKAHNS